jgi:hypothetical protein
MHAALLPGTDAPSLRHRVGYHSLSLGKVVLLQKRKIRTNDIEAAVVALVPLEIACASKTNWHQSEKET